MRWVTTLAVVLLVAVSAGAASSAETGSSKRPALRITGLSPLSVQGLNFKPLERVKLLAFADRLADRDVRAGRTGTFAVTFSLRPGRCTAFVIQAFGNRGSRAMTDRTAPACTPPSIKP